MNVEESVAPLLSVCLQATCSEAEASKRLSDALAAADAAQQALQEQRSTNGGLTEQLTALQEQLAQVGDTALSDCLSECLYELVNALRFRSMRHLVLRAALCSSCLCSYVAC